MPVLQNANGDDYKMVRGKTIECVSLIGLAVGSEKFMDDAQVRAEAGRLPIFAESVVSALSLPWLLSLTDYHESTAANAS